VTQAAKSFVSRDDAAADVTEPGDNAIPRRFCLDLFELDRRHCSRQAPELPHLRSLSRRTRETSSG
jgi:hypothetical protein